MIVTRAGLATTALDAVLSSYSQVLFSRRRAVGALLLLATFVVPSVGAVGLLGVVLAGGLALALGLDREAVRSGVLGYNALLVFLLVGASLDRSAAFWALSAVLAGGVVLTHQALSSALGYHLRLPALSLPFVAVGWLALAAVPHVRGMGFVERLPALELGSFPGPAWVDTLLRSLGAIFLQPYWGAGLLVLAALLVFSRIATLHALLGFGVAVFADRFLFSFPADFIHLYVGFNFIMTAVALGGIFYVPGPASLLLATFGSLSVGWLSVALVQVLQPSGLPVLALPFNLAVLVILYALARRGLGARPRPVDFIAGSPEDNLNHYRTRIERFRSELPVPLALPFRGAWLCTQGNDGEYTHQGAWRHGLDFEVVDRAGERCRKGGGKPRDWLCYGLPVVAPAAGTVARIVDGLPDNAVGEMDTDNNWGNLVILQHAAGMYTMVSHLQPGSVAVKEGEVVAQGDELGRVGSSGRAPVPHLHFQVQATPTVGDPTLPVEFAGLIVQGDDERLAQRHTPAEGDRIRNVTRHDPLAHALALPVGQRLTVRVRAAGLEREEELVSDVDLLGNRSLYSPSRDARLWFENRGGTFVVYDHSGPRDGALFAWYAALARLPLEDCRSLTWTDHLNPRRLGSRPLAWLRDAAAALVPPRDQEVSYRSERDGDRLIVRGEAPGAPGQRPVTTEAWITLGGGVERLRVDVGGRVVEVLA